MARPAGVEGRLPAVLVVHENRGLNPYIEDVVRRLGKAGYLALGPDGLTSLGGYPGNDEEGRELQSQVDPAKLMQDFFAGYEYLAAHPGSTGKVGCVGFCYGGGVCNALAVAYPELAASVPFYGRQPDVADVPSIQAPLLLHYAGLDERVNAGWPAYEAALKANGKVYEAYIYEGANHGFHNDTTPALRRGGGDPRLGAHPRLVREAPERRRLTHRSGVNDQRSLSICVVHRLCMPCASRKPLLTQRIARPGPRSGPPLTTW